MKSRRGKMLKDSLVEILEPIRLYFFKINWRKFNKHNFTNAYNRFPINRVKIGYATYGKINIQHYQNPNSKVIIKNFCSIADGVKFILGGEHKYSSFSTYPFKRKFLNESYEAETKGNIIINDDVWIGVDVIVLSGIEIGQGCIIGAGSIVSKNIPPYAVFAGGKIIKYRFSSDIIDKLLLIDYERIDRVLIQDNIDIVYTDDINLFLNSDFYKAIIRQDLVQKIE